MFLWIARVFLVLNALIFVFVGKILFRQPMLMENLGFELVSPTGITAIRTWGGFFLGTGLIGLIAATRARWTVPGLFIILIIGVVIFVDARIFDILIDGAEPLQWSELRDESLGAILAIIGLIFAALHSRRARSAG
jgi:hypothetical protein